MATVLIHFYLQHLKLYCLFLGNACKNFKWVFSLWDTTRNELSWGAPLDWGSERGGVIKGVSTGPDMFAECGNIPHLKGRIRHLKEK